MDVKRHELAEKVKLEVRILSLEATVALLTGDEEAAEKYKEQIEITVKNFQDEIMKL